MPKVKTHKARTDIYERGIRIPDEKTKTGYRRDKSQPADENDKIFVKKGETYYAWGMMVGGRGVQRQSKTYPRRSQLTNSDFLSQIYDLEDDLNFSEAVSAEDLEGQRDEVVSRLRDLGQEQQDKYDNMPDGLQQGDTGQLLETRAQACEQIADELDSVDLDDFDTELEENELDELKDQVREEEGLEEGAEVADDNKRLEELVEEKKSEKEAEWVREKADELENVSWDYE